jgi:DNA-binding Xre family transcriptional regulator
MIKNRLKEWLAEAGLNYQQASAKTGVHEQTVSKYAANRVDRLDLAVVEKLCDGMGKRVEDFLYGDSND